MYYYYYVLRILIVNFVLVSNGIDFFNSHFWQAGSEESKTRQRRNVPQPGQAAPEGVRGPGGRRGGARMRRPAAPSNSPSNNQQGGDGPDDDNR